MAIENLAKRSPECYWNTNHNEETNQPREKINHLYILYHYKRYWHTKGIVIDTKNYDEYSLCLEGVNGIHRGVTEA